VRKASAEDYPKNFALLSLAEKTLAKARQHQQEMMQAQQMLQKMKMSNHTTCDHHSAGMMSQEAS
jgi:hypothetical protein